MKIKLFYLLFGLILITTTLASPISIVKQAHAGANWACSIVELKDSDGVASGDIETIDTNDYSISKLVIDVGGGENLGNDYIVWIAKDNEAAGTNDSFEEIEERGGISYSVSGSRITITGKFDPNGNPAHAGGNPFGSGGDYGFIVTKKSDGTSRSISGVPNAQNQCRSSSYDVGGFPASMKINVVQARKCDFNFSSLKSGEDVKISVSFNDAAFRNGSGGNPAVFDIDTFDHPNPTTSDTEIGDTNRKQNAAELEGEADYSIGNFTTGDYSVRISRLSDEGNNCIENFHIDLEGGSSGCTDSDGANPCRDGKTCSEPDPDTRERICEGDEPYDAGKGLLACEEVQGYEVASGRQVGTGIFKCHTALGEVRTDAQGFMKTVLSLILGLAGGILIIVIIINGYKFMFSQGDPEKIKDAREGIIAAVMGIFLIIFSLTLLTIVTSNVLQLPGFSR